MHTSLVLSAVLGAGALAQPRLRHGGVHRYHQKRDEDILVPDGDGFLLEHVYDVYVTVPPSGPPASTASANTGGAPVPVRGKFARPGFDGGPNFAFQRRPVDQVFTTAPPSGTSQPPVVPAVPEADVVQPPQTAQSAAVAQGTSAPQTGGGSPPPASGAWDTSPCIALPNGDCRDLLSATNAWRHQWYNNQSDYTYSSARAENAYQCASAPVVQATNTNGSPQVDKNGKPVMWNEGGGISMYHHLFPGSLAQVEAGGVNDASGAKAVNSSYTATSYEVALLMWMCETPTDEIMDGCRAINSKNDPQHWAPPSAANGNDPVEAIGHALILKGTSQDFGCICTFDSLSWNLRTKFVANTLQSWAQYGLAISPEPYTAA
ncbi:hypothetical protein MMC21_004677 [Puttea exsequens]|nr:hypothetical protein [Puttea exsequens]